MAGSRFRSTGAPTTALQSACSCSRWLRTSLLGFYGGWGLAEKSPHSLRVAQLDDSIGNTPTTVSWRVWGYEVGLGWRLASSGISLPNNVFSWLLSDFTGPFSRPKNPSKTCAPQGASPVLYSSPPSPIQWLSLVHESDTECWTCCSNWSMFLS